MLEFSGVIDGIPKLRADGRAPMYRIRATTNKKPARLSSLVVEEE